MEYKYKKPISLLLETPQMNFEADCPTSFCTHRDFIDSCGLCVPGDILCDRK